jgi:hypothetical protein
MSTSASSSKRSLAASEAMETSTAMARVSSYGRLKLKIRLYSALAKLMLVEGVLVPTSARRQLVPR